MTKRIDAALQISPKAKRLDNIIDPDRPPRHPAARSHRFVTSVRRRRKDVETLTANTKFLLGGGETGSCYPDLNRAVIHMSRTPLAADLQRTPHSP